MSLDNFNIAIFDENISATTTSQELIVPATVKYLRFYPTSGEARVQFNNTGNSPKLIIKEPMTIQNKDGRITSLWIDSAATATLNVKGLFHPAGRIERVLPDGA